MYHILYSYPQKWDTKVKDIMGEDFRFADDQRTQEASIRDLLAHKMSLHSYGAVWLVGLDQQHTRQEYCRSGTAGNLC